MHASAKFQPERRETDESEFEYQEECCAKIKGVATSNKKAQKKAQEQGSTSKGSCNYKCKRCNGEFDSQDEFEEHTAPCKEAQREKGSLINILSIGACGICRENYGLVAPEELGIAECGHVFHKRCLSELLAHGKSYIGGAKCIKCSQTISGQMELRF